MLYEHIRSRNLFAIVLGGVQMVPSFRDTSARSQGAFQHAILAGTFGTTLMPLLLWLWKSSKSKLPVIVGLIASGIMVLTSNSSTPVMALTGAFAALCLWPLRDWMRTVRWCMVLGILVLHIIMKAPFWFLLAHIDVTGSSTGYFRATLIDQAVNHFSDWWLMGTNINGWWGEDMWDLSDQFVAEAFSGGLLTLLLFVTMISLCFRRIGIARKSVEGDRKQEWLMWLLGVALFGHVMVFFGVSYWDQMWVSWASLLVIITTATVNHMVVPAKESTIEMLAVPVSYRAGSLQDSVSSSSNLR